MCGSSFRPSSHQEHRCGIAEHKHSTFKSATSVHNASSQLVSSTGITELAMEDDATTTKAAKGHSDTKQLSSVDHTTFGEEKVFNLLLENDEMLTEEWEQLDIFLSGFRDFDELPSNAPDHNSFCVTATKQQSCNVVHDTLSKENYISKLDRLEKCMLESQRTRSLLARLLAGERGHSRKESESMQDTSSSSLHS